MGVVTRLECIYRQLPTFVQNIACSAEGWRIQKRRYGLHYQSIETLVRSREALAGGIRTDLQLARLKQHLKAATASPFWIQRFKEYGVSADADNPMEQLKNLPILTKTEVQRTTEEIRNRSLPQSSLLSCHTSGTTGAGLKFVETRASEQERWAVWWRYRSWHQIAPDMWCGYFGGRSVVPLDQMRAPYWRINNAGKQVLFSGYHLSPSTSRCYLKALDEYKLPWLHGYPSLLSLLATFLMEAHGHLAHPPKIISTGAENLLAKQKHVIEQAFGCRVVQHYGQSESVANMSECEAGSLHVDEDFSLVEFIPVPDLVNTYRIVGTNWSNPAFPLFRYDTGDHARLSSISCPCGRPGRIVESIDGRQEDYVILPNGARLGRLDHIFKDLVNVREAQIHQSQPGSITIRIIRGDEYSLNDEHELLNQTRARMGHEMSIQIEYVTALAKSNSGKLRFVISELK